MLRACAGLSMVIVWICSSVRPFCFMSGTIFIGMWVTPGPPLIAVPALHEPGQVSPDGYPWHLALDADASALTEHDADQP